MGGDNNPTKDPPEREELNDKRKNWKPGDYFATFLKFGLAALATWAVLNWYSGKKSGCYATDPKSNKTTQVTSGKGQTCPPNYVCNMCVSTDGSKITPATLGPNDTCSSINKAWCDTKPGMTWQPVKDPSLQGTCEADYKYKPGDKPDCCCGQILPCASQQDPNDKSVTTGCGFFCVKGGKPFPGPETEADCKAQGGSWETGSSKQCDWKCAGDDLLNGALDVAGDVIGAAVDAVDTAANILKWITQHWWVFIIVGGVILAIVIAVVAKKKKTPPGAPAPGDQLQMSYQQAYMAPTLGGTPAGAPYMGRSY